MGRAVLVNSVLDSQLIYLMSVMLLPQGALDAFDKRRRAFLWAGEGQVHGAQCLVAWERACQLKEQGGLGLKNIAIQNKSMLLKLLHRLHTSDDSSWARWVRGRIDMITMHGDISGPHWQELEKLLPLYRSVTVCEVNNGDSTSFWLDRWLSVGRLVDTFPFLYSHATDPEVSVAEVVAEGLDQFLVPHLTWRARAELDKVSQLLDMVTLQQADDRRTSPLAAADNVLRAGPVYRLVMTTLGAPTSPFSTFVWENKTPPRVQFFTWLLVQERIQCRANLVVKNVIDSATCALCQAADEDCNHLLFSCPFAAKVWQDVGFQIDEAEVSTLWSIQRPGGIPAKHYHTLLHLLCWHIWKHRNDVVFNSLPASHARLWHACKEDARLWSQRWPAVDRVIADSWCSRFPIM